MVDENLETSEKTEKDALEKEREQKEQEHKEEKLAPFHEHPRFKEVYKGMKTSQRENESLKDDLQALREANEELMSTMESVDDKVFNMKEIPDYNEDPKGFTNHILEQAKRELKQETSTPKKETQVKPVNNKPTPELNMLEVIETGLHADYHEIVNKYAVEDMKADKALELTIMQSANPARAAYNYALDKKQKVEAKKQANINTGLVEGGQHSNESNQSNEIILTDKHKRAARALGVPEDKYLARLKEIRKVIK